MEFSEFIKEQNLANLLSYNFNKDNVGNFYVDGKNFIITSLDLPYVLVSQEEHREVRAVGLDKNLINTALFRFKNGFAHVVNKDERLILTPEIKVEQGEYGYPVYKTIFDNEYMFTFGAGIKALQYVLFSTKEKGKLFAKDFLLDARGINAFFFNKKPEGFNILLYPFKEKSDIKVGKGPVIVVDEPKYHTRNELIENVLKNVNYSVQKTVLNNNTHANEIFKVTSKEVIVIGLSVGLKESIYEYVSINDINALSNLLTNIFSEL